MKRNYPQAGPNSQPQGGQQTAYGQPPAAAGSAPAYPSSGPPQQAAYANYGYGSVAPSRHAAAPLNGAAASDAQPPQWNQQWQQAHQYYPQQQQPSAAAPPGAGQFVAPRPPSQPGPYRGMGGPNAGSPSLNQSSTFSPHQSQQPMSFAYQSQASSMQSQSPSQHHQPPAPPSYAYTPPVPQHQNVVPQNNSNAQNWPGAFATGSQVGPPSKKPRYQAPAAPVPTPAHPYIPSGVAPMAPMAGNMAGGAAAQYPAPSPANPSSQQPYAWQGPATAAVPHLNPQPLPGHPGPQGRVPSASGFQANMPGRGGQAGHAGKGDRAGRAASAANVSSRGMNRNGPQNRGNMQQASSGQRAGLPANPNTSVNAARAPNGQTRTWGSHTSSANLKASVLPGTGASAQHGGGFHAGRRGSTSSSVHSDKNASGSAKKLGSSAQNMTPPSAPRGPNNARNKAGKANPNAPVTGSQALKNGRAVAAQAVRGDKATPAGVKAAVGAETDSHVQDSTTISAAVAAKESGASSKRAHTDFRILGLEIQELGWSWLAPQALVKEVVAADEIKDERSDSKQDLAQIKVNADEVPVEVEQANNASAEGGADADVVPSADGEHVENAADGAEKETRNAEVEQDEKRDGDTEHGQERADRDGDADDAGADSEADENAEAEEDVTTSVADTDTVASNPQHSVAQTPELSGEPPKGPKAEALKLAAQNGKGSKADRGKAVASMRDSTKLRFCFAATSNAGPEGAPTGPKAQIQEQNAKAEKRVEDKTTADQSEQKPVVEGLSESVDADVEMTQDLDTISAEDAEAERRSKQVLEQNGSAKELEDDSGTDAKEAEPAGASNAVQPTHDPASTVEESAQPKDGDASAPVEEVETKHEPTDKGESAIPTEQPQAEDEAITSPKVKKSRSVVESSASQAKGPPQLSLNRIFLSFAANRKRLAIDAEAVKSVKIHRSEHWVEIRIDTSQRGDPTAMKKGEEYLVCKGTLLEKRGKGQENYTAVTRAEIVAAWEAADRDTKPADAPEQVSKENLSEEHLELPPFFRVADSISDVCELTLLVRLDPSAPLPEPVWLRRNDVASLLADLQRGSSAVAGQSQTAISVGAAQHVWAGKIEVLDPEPPPSMKTLLYEWVKESFIGSQKERRKFVDELLNKQHRSGKPDDNPKVKVEAEVGGEESDRERDVRVGRAFIEIILRLVKGERVSIPTTTTATGGEAVAFANVLASASLTSSTTYPGLIMLGLIQLLLDNPISDPAVVRAQVDALLMQIPRATLFKALDLTWKDVVEVDRKTPAPSDRSVSTAGKGAQTHTGRNRHQMGRHGQGHGQAQNRHGKRKRV